MVFGVISINYLNTPIEIRDQVSLRDTDKMEVYTKLHDKGIHQAVILSTCNRSEVYVMLEDDIQIQHVQSIVQSMFLPLDINQYIIIKMGYEAIQYLFEVTSGLHSLVLGEDQILGQVKDALQLSKEMGSSHKQIEKLFREAITCAKHIKTTLKINEHPISLSYIGIQQLRKICGIQGKKVLVLGSGKMAELVMMYLYEDKVQHVWNANRSISSAKRLKEQYPQLEICEFSKRYECLASCDIVISATSSPHIILKKQDNMEYTNNIIMLDLASPRDIDPNFPHVYNIDSLQDIAQEHKQQRLQKVEEGQKMIVQYVREVNEWLMTSNIDSSIQTLQEHIEEVVQDTYMILNRKLQMNERERYILKKTLYASMQRLMKEPIQNLKSIKEEEQTSYQQMIEQIFIKPNKGEFS